MTRRQINEQAFAALWNNYAVPIERIAGAMGLSHSGVRWHARRIGLPLRPRGNRPKYDPSLLAKLWMAGVSSAEIANHFGLKNRSCVGAAAHKLGLPKREKGGRSGRRNGGWKRCTPMSEVIDQMAAEAMGISAAETQSVLIKKKMVDHRHSGQRKAV